MSLSLGLGLCTRKLIYKTLRMMHNLSTTKYSLVSIKLDDKRFKLYTHYEGLQVIDEILLLGQYHLAYRLKPRVVIDVGAHIGIFTVSMAKHIKEVCNNGLIIAIEPVSINYNAMLNNIEINMVKDIVKPIRAAVASKEDYIEVEWIGVRERVKTVTMNRLIEIVKEKGYNYIDLVKIDIEGAELEILTNNNKWLEYVRAIVMELHPDVYGIEGIKSIAKALKEKGFEIKHIKKTISTKLALKKWIENVNPNPSQLVLTTWKSLVTIYFNRININYWFAMKK